MVLILIQVVISIVTLILFGMFLPGYWKQKGKNLADKDDIAEITNLVESVKTDHAKQLNSLNHEVSLINSIFSAHRNEERSSIIEFNESYNYWLYKHFSVNLYLYKYPSKENIESINQLSSDLVEYHSAVNQSLSKLTLLTQNGFIRALGNDMVINLIEFHSWTIDNILKLKFNIEDGFNENNKFIELMIDTERNIDRMKPISINIDKLEKNSIDLVSYHVNNKIKPFRKCQKESLEFEHMCREYLLSTNLQ